MNSKIAVIGKGNVGGALTRGLGRAGHELRTIGNAAGDVRSAGAWADVVVLAVPYPAIDPAIDAVVAELGDSVRGKVVVDVTNALTAELELAVGFTTSGAEELQKKLRAARVVKAFNTVFAEHMDTGQLNRTPLTVLAAGDDVAAKAAVLKLAQEIGFDAVDAGPLMNARWLEALGYLNIQLGYMLKMGTQIGFTLVR
jgi:8-hydroxy-5-deazaflavin:NADPH oxidoreductase